MSDHQNPTVILAAGDVILDVSQEEGTGSFSYRVDSQTLKQNSRYFENLLSSRFSEGSRLTAALEELKKLGYSNIADVPTERLHRIQIINVGRILTKSTIQNLTADFLRALHSQDLTVSKPSVANLANLAVVGDRFDALASLTRYIRKKKYLQATDGNLKSRSNINLAEEKVRQKLLIGLFLDHPPWVTKYSKQLILRDSMRWSPHAEEDDTLALWWDIPGGVEDEMIQRREFILETINSLQSHFLKLYASGERQCKLGYDSSPECDSFQLGEMVRFFLRLGTLRLQGTIYDVEEPPQYAGDIERLLETFRQCSSYQVDRNHSHCGLRVRILPLLDLIQNQLSLDTGSLDVGICHDCWENNRAVYAWSLSKRPVMWTPTTSLTGNRGLNVNRDPRSHRRSSSSCLNRHTIVRDMFTAAQKDWTVKDSYSLAEQTPMTRIR